MSDDEYYDDEGGEEYEEEYEASPEEIRAAAQRSLRFVNCLVFIMGCIVCGVAYGAGLAGHGGAWVPYVAAGMGLTAVFVSCLGCCGASGKNQRILLLYYSLIVLATMALVIAGGFCFIFTQRAVDFVQKNWVTISVEGGNVVAADSAAESAAAADQLKLMMQISGAMSWMLALILMCAMGNVVRLVEKVTAYTILLQATNMTLMPFGIILIAAAAFIADTAASVDAPTTAFAIFILGVFVIVVSFLGCFGTSISSRGLVKLSMIMVSILAFMFFVFGIVAFTQASTLKSSIIARWEQIRRVLPPTFSGKYDKEQFISFIETNLNAMGFGALCMGMLLAVIAWGGKKLRAALKDQADEGMWDGPALPDASFTGRSTGHNAQAMWKRAWSHGTKSSRRMIKCGCGCICCLVILIVGGSCAALYFSTSCSTLAEFSSTVEFFDPRVKDAAFANVAFPPVRSVYVYSNYTRGLLHVVVNKDIKANAGIFFTKSAFKESMANPEEPVVLLKNSTPASNSLTLTAEPKAATRVAGGFDISCQAGDVSVQVPPKGVMGDTMAASRTGMVIYMAATSTRDGVRTGAEVAAGADAPRFRHVSLAATIGPVTFEGTKLGADGASARTTAGEIVLKDVDAQCDPINLGTGFGQIRLKTSLGSVLVGSTILKDCELVGMGEASLVQVDGVTSSNSLGTGSLIRLEGIKGLVEAKDSTSDVFNLKSGSGSVRASGVVARENLKAATTTGAVIIEAAKIALGGSVQVETTGGNVQINLKQFSGFISINTSGQVSVTGCTTKGCDKAHKHYGDMVLVNDATTKVNSATGNVNCASEGLCAYRGELIVTSSTGNVVLDVEAWAPSS